MSNIAKIKRYCIANGEGLRTAVFFSGCTHKCKGCFNQCAWDFNYGNKIASFRTTLGDEISVYLYENENGVWAELYVTNIELLYSYAIKSAYVKLAKNDNAFIWIRHDNNLYDVIVSKYEGDII